MSDERLRQKLVAAGFEEDVVVAMERETMLSTYAEFLASGGVRPGAAAQAGYDPEVEAQKLAFEKQRWEAEREDKLRREEVEREERKAEREEKKAEREDRLRKEEAEREERLRKEEAEQRRWEVEQRRWEADRVERQRKELAEDERRQTEMQQQAELFAQRQRELDRQTARDRAEEARRDSAVLKGKLFGDAMRASAIRMGVDPIEAIPFFRNVEQLFDVYDVPAELRPVLVRPFLNDNLRLSLGNWVLRFWEIMSISRRLYLKNLSYLLMCILTVLIHIGKSIVKVTWHLLPG